MRRKAVQLLITAVILSVVTSCGAMTLIEKYRDIKAGDWVVLEVSDGTITLLSVAEKDKDFITIEMKERTNPGKGKESFLLSWRQIRIDLQKKEAVLVREKNIRTGEIQERNPLPDEGIDEVLRAEFVEAGEEELKQKLKFWDKEQKKVVEKRMTFSCTYYKAIVNKKLIEIWCSEEILLYPIKVRVYNPNATVKLIDHGEGWKSHFFPPKEGPKPEKLR